jgi:SMODS domain-containing protein
MAIAPAPFFTESFEAQIDDLLMRICVDLQLDQTHYKLAEDHYKAVGKWLEADGSPLTILKPIIYPQGSMQLNTTVKPLAGDEYDLDFVCELVCQTEFFEHPVDALNLIERRLKDNATYRPMVQRMNRCIRLNYEHQFHMDILPACRDPKNGGTCLLVPDRKLEDWKASNPKGYAAWFESKAHQLLVDQLLEKAEPIPDQETAEEKATLKLAVQLLKRWRDVRYKNNCDLAPISIVLTTLAAHLYRGERSISLTMGNILGGISKLVKDSHPRLSVPNPSNSREDLSERWDAKPETYTEFVKGMGELDAQWRALLQTRGIDKVTKTLERLFGEDIAKRVVEKQTRDIEASRSRGELGMKKGSGIIASMATGSVLPIHPNTFYGDES